MSERGGAASSSAAGGRPGPTKPARSKAACVACHQAKQRCNGPPGPCYRCTTWGMECVFPSSAGPVASTKSRTSRSSTPPVKGKAAAAAAAAAETAASTAAAVQQAAAVSPDVAEQLRVMNARLESLEAALVRSQTSSLPSSSPHPGTPHSSSLNPALHGHPLSHSRPTGGSGSQNGSEAAMTPASGSHNSSGEHHHPREDVLGVGVNAVETAGEAMAIEGLVDLGGGGGAGRGQQGGEAQFQLGGWDSNKPDVLAKGIMTLEECQAEFNLYFEHLQPWTCLLSTSLDRDPLVVRDRSPLLFHAILLLTLYYRPRTPPNIILYRAVSSILHSILAPQILCPQPDQLSADFVRAVHLLTMYKPLQWAALNARGVADPARIESSSKMNVTASWILRLLVSRVSAFVGLPSVATSFAQAFANQHLAPIPDAIVSQTRLFLALVSHDFHGALQSGKLANFNPQDACKVTRLFASLRKQPSDVRLAASVELVATASTALLARKEDGVLEDEDLRRFDAELDAWSEYWSAQLEAQQHTTDATAAHKEAWSLFYPYASFTRLTVRGFAFNKWRAERKERAAQRAASLGGLSLPGDGKPGAGSGPPLGADERESIAKAVQVAEEMMCAVAASPAGRELRSGKAKPGGKSVEAVWRSVGERPLVPEPEVVGPLKWASDSLTCVMFSYPLIFLAKLANEGLLSSDLTVITPNSLPLPPQPMQPSDKLCRLFQLGADLLDAIAPNAHHPAIKQAAFLRKVWDAGISGRRSVTSAPSSPKFPAGVDPSAGLAGGAVGQMNPPQFSLGAAATHLAAASMPPPHPAALAAAQANADANGSAASAFPSLTIPHTLPPLPNLPAHHHPPPPSSSSSAHMPPPSAAATLAPPLHPPVDPSLSAAYSTTTGQSTPFGSPPFAAAPPALGSLSVADDPFAALLSGVSPAMFSGGEDFFSLDGEGGGTGVGLDWAGTPTLGSGASGGGGAGGAGGVGGVGEGGWGMQF
ncbi:hypothetical protein JCM8097_003861 [Rhodosporidiobolus ruineniae]